jgi:carboxyl-terminal processing protease
MNFKQKTKWPAATVLATLLAACGGGGGDAGDIEDVAPPASCSTPDRQDFLARYFDAEYFWYRLSPAKPTPGSIATVADYFDALLYQGGGLIPNGNGARWPRDRYSGFQSTESYNRFFGNGQTLGYGLAVNGLEAVEQRATRLFVRYVEPASPAAAAGVIRGDEVISLKERPVSELIAANNGDGDFSALAPTTVGDQLTAVIRNAQGVQRSVALNAAVYALTPVQNNKVVQSQGGRLMGYVTVKDMIDQADAPLTSAMQTFIGQGVREFVLDMRYNGGGLVRVGRNVASHISGAAANNQVFSRLLYNDKQAANNSNFLFGNPSNWAGVNKVYVLMGPRTCSASEQVINGLLGVGVNVVAVGSASCGKPVGFQARDDGCGTTYSVTNFESVNARNEGRYFNGFAPTCQVSEDLTRPAGDPNDPLLVAAAFYVDNNSCPAGTGKSDIAFKQAQEKQATRKRYNGADGGERVGMTKD